MQLFLFSTLLILVDLDDQYFDSIFVQFFLFYLHFFFFFFLSANSIFFKVFGIVAKSLGFFSITVLIILYFIYNFFKNASEIFGIFFQQFIDINLLLESINPFIFFCKLYILYCFLVLIVSIPTFLIFFLVKKPMSLRNKIMIRNEFFLLIKILMLACAPYNMFVFIPLSISTANFIDSYINATNEQRYCTFFRTVKF